MNKPKVFVSYKLEDRDIRDIVVQKCQSAGLNPYVDKDDDYVDGDREDLVEHLAAHIKNGHGVIVAVSDKTKDSWWVPLEVGIGYENDMPITAWTESTTVYLPSYLERVRSTRYSERFVKWTRQVKSRHRDAGSMSETAFNIQASIAFGRAQRHPSASKYFYWFR